MTGNFLEILCVLIWTQLKKFLPWPLDIRSSSKVCSYQQKDHDGSESDDEICLDSIEIEKGKIQRFNNDEDGVKNLEKKLTSFWGRLVTCARLAVMRKNRTEGRICPGRLARGLLGSFRKISFYRKKRFYRKKNAEIEWCWDSKMSSVSSHMPSFPATDWKMSSFYQCQVCVSTQRVLSMAPYMENSPPPYSLPPCFPFLLSKSGS